MQLRLTKEKPKVNYCYGPYNDYDSKEQWIRLSEGCPHNCPWCYEPKKIKVFKIPRIIRNEVKIIDMNFFVPKKDPLKIIEELGSKKVGGKLVYYELVCGLDYRFLTQELSDALKRNRFHNIRLAWDNV